MRKEIPQGQMLPRFYGLAWIDYQRGFLRICYPMPLNWIFGWARAALFIIKYGPVKMVRKVEEWMK